ncbi:MAG TPA: 4Fe-4S ferredoxin [Lachnospiraceae bacterium]|nr:EFR1 family ferrodoxin [uncultured Lachnoclostridium sp.]HAU84057.1 4Fe-4S ferredoxin [Lachnospiraceae bacterium]
MIFYFTATGNSLYVAKQLEEKPISIAQAIHDKNMSYKAEKIGIVCPVFGHEVPALVREFLEKANFETPYFYMILTYGNRHGGAAWLAENMLKEIGINPSYINVLLMVDNFLPGFDMDEQKRLDKKVDEHIKMIREDITNDRQYISPVTDKDRAAHKEYLTRMAHMPKDAFSNIYRITNECIGCEICTKVCPKNCFTMDGQRSVWHSEGCITCMACIHACPMMAIQMNMPEKNEKARYRNENISICEIVGANNQLNITE